MAYRVSEILDALRVLVHALEAGSRTSEERLGLTGAQLFVLEKLAGVRAMSVNELAAATHTRQSTVSVVVSKLVRKALVARERSRADARVQMLSITARGAKKLERAPETVQDRLIKAIDRLSHPEQQALASSLHGILAHAGLSDVLPEFFLERTNDHGNK